MKIVKYVRHCPQRLALLTSAEHVQIDFQVVYISTKALLVSHSFSGQANHCSFEKFGWFKGAWLIFILYIYMYVTFPCVSSLTCNIYSNAGIEDLLEAVLVVALSFNSLEICIL